MLIWCRKVRAEKHWHGQCHPTRIEGLRGEVSPSRVTHASPRVAQVLQAWAAQPQEACHWDFSPPIAPGTPVGHNGGMNKRRQIIDGRLHADSIKRRNGKAASF